MSTQPPPSKPAILVQLTDLHLREAPRLSFGLIDTGAYLRTAVESVLKLRQRPDAVVITGDLTDSGRAAEYDSLRELLTPLAASGLPIYLMPGNHDDREQLRRSFPDHGYLGSGPYLQYSVDVGPLRLLALDTCVPGRDEGALCDERLAWLEAQLAASTGTPVVI